VGHYGNWEWGGLALSDRADHQVLNIYKPLAYEPFDRWIKAVRSRFGAELVPMQQTARAIFHHEDQNQPTITMLITDQTPPVPDKAAWVDFLNQQTPVFLGAEKLARKFEMPVIYCHIRKVKRGYYETEFIPIIEKPKQTEDLEITTAHTCQLEKSIRQEPAYWLWSHRRWKHDPPH
jgi:KDO2-lipid IV(A) lauroyltransferase